MCKKYGIYVILSQWYYLHTYWYQKAGDPVADELFSIPPEERFEAFGRFWHYILRELEKRNLDSQIAFVEIFNEVNEHPYYCGEGVSYIAFLHFRNAKISLCRRRNINLYLSVEERGTDAKCNGALVESSITERCV